MKKFFILSILIMFMGTLSVSASDKTEDKEIVLEDGTVVVIKGIRIPRAG